VSKTYEKGGQDWYWFTFHRHQREFLEQAEESFAAFGCGSENTLVLIPASEFMKWLEDLNFRETDNRYYWYVHISKEDNRLLLHRSKGKGPIDLTEFVIPGESGS
jgi:hypothetical protein